MAGNTSIAAKKELLSKINMMLSKGWIRKREAGDWRNGCEIFRSKKIKMDYDLRDLLSIMLLNNRMAKSTTGGTQRPTNFTVTLRDDVTFSPAWDYYVTMLSFKSSFH